MASRACFLIVRGSPPKSTESQETPSKTYTGGTRKLTFSRRNSLVSVELLGMIYPKLSYSRAAGEIVGPAQCTSDRYWKGRSERQCYQTG
jgi:hypothetical protein